jgi:hypothetical protein
MSNEDGAVGANIANLVNSLGQGYAAQQAREGPARGLFLLWLSLRGEHALQVALVGDEEFLHVEDVIGRDIRPAPNRPRVQLQLKFEHRSAVLGIHFLAFLAPCSFASG